MELNIFSYLYAINHFHSRKLHVKVVFLGKYIKIKVLAGYALSPMLNKLSMTSVNTWMRALLLHRDIILSVSY